MAGIAAGIIIGGTIMAAGSYMQYKGNKKAAEMERKGLENQNQANKFQNAVKRRALIQSVRMSIGTVATSYAASGAGSSRTSSQQAVMSSQRTGVSRAMYDAAVLQNFGDAAVDFSFEAQRGRTFASLGGGVAAIGSMIASSGMSFGGGKPE